MNTETFKKGIRATSIMGIATLANIIFGLLRMKIAAVLVGPVGVGVLGIYQSLVTTVATAFACGIGTSSTRQIAENNTDDGELAIAIIRKSLAYGTIILALIGGATFYALRDILSTHFFAGDSKSNEIRWLSFCIFLLVITGSQSGFLNGLGKTGYLARIQIFSGFLALSISSVGLLIYGENALVLFTVAMPLSTFVFSLIYINKIKKFDKIYKINYKKIFKSFRYLIVFGFAVMVASLITSIGHLAVRYIIQNQLSLASVGIFQAAWTISLTYMGFVLVAMRTDYYPRLTCAINDKIQSHILMEQQTLLALMLGGSAMLLVLTLSDWIISILYTVEFKEASLVLRWQLLGDVFKLMSWPLGIALMALGAGKILIVTEAVSVIVYVLLAIVLIPIFKLEGVGLAYVGYYLMHFVLVYFYTHNKLDYKCSPAIYKAFSLYFLSALIIIAVGSSSTIYKLFFGFLFFTVSLMSSFFFISLKIESNNKLFVYMKRILPFRWIKK